MQRPHFIRTAACKPLPAAGGRARDGIPIDTPDNLRSDKQELPHDKHWRPNAGFLDGCHLSRGSESLLRGVRDGGLVQQSFRSCSASGISLRLEGGHDSQPGFSIHCRKHVGVASDLLKVSFWGQTPGCFVRLFLAGKEMQKAIRKMRTSSEVDLKSRSIKANARSRSRT
jgi:hypothetical protein